MSSPAPYGRRRFLGLVLGAPVALALQTRPALAEKLAAAAAKLAPTPDCDDGDEPTPSETQGPFFKPQSPLRTSLLERDMEGTKIVLTGVVFGGNCQPRAGALVDFWHADDEGEYDNQGFRLRGHQFTDASGRYRLETIVPGLYPGRTRHFHVKVQAPKGRVLMTQLYFPEEPRNRRDFLYRPELLMAVRDASGAKQARFHFLLDG
jgi:protocatechuate 3,4-dioxygenase beta subunit